MSVAIESASVLKAQIKEASDKLTAIVNQATEEQRDLSESEGATMDELETRIQNLDRKFKVAEREERQRSNIVSAKRRRPV